MSHASDPVTDRLFCHMAWANAQTFAVLASLPATVFALCEPGNDWSVGMIVQHLTEAATGYASRLDGTPYTALPFAVVSTHAELAIAMQACATADARLRVAAANPHGVVELQRKPFTRARSTVLAQSIHHATEHRAQIAGALVSHGVTALALDDLDLWAYSDAEGLGA